MESLNDDPIETSASSKRHANHSKLDTSDHQKSDVIVEGSPGSTWDLVCKASSKSQGWMKVTKRMVVEGGWLYQVTTEHRSTVTGEVVACAEALQFVPAFEEADPEPLVE